VDFAYFNATAEQFAKSQIVLESGRLPGAAVVSDAGLGTEFPRLFPPDRTFQAQFEPESMDPLEGYDLGSM
jgi:hypothetical protein